MLFLLTDFAVHIRKIAATQLSFCSCAGFRPIEFRQSIRSKVNFRPAALPKFCTAQFTSDKIFTISLNKNVL